MNIKWNVGRVQSLFKFKPIYFEWKFTFVGEGKASTLLSDFFLMVAVECGLQGLKNPQ